MEAMTDELVKRLRSMHWCVTTETNGVGVSDRKVALEAADRIEQLVATNKQLTAERERLALAICGGEDAPGYANAQTVETLEHVAKQNQQSHGETINSLLAAQAERDQWIAHSKNAVWADSEELKLVEAERDRLRKELEKIVDDCEAEYPPSHGAIKYAARMALKGE